MILITGGLGFIGSALARRLLAMGERVRIFDDLSRGALRRRPECAEIAVGDIRDIGHLLPAMADVTAVFHLAAINGTANFYKRPGSVLNVGVIGTLNAIKCCLRTGAGLLLASSSEVYQTPDRIPTDETAPLSIPDPYNPRYSYGASKIIGEMLTIHASLELTRAVIVRPHNIYGPDMGEDHVIPQMARKIARGEPIEFQLEAPPPTGWSGLRQFWGGEETRAFCHIDDAVEGIIVAWKRGRDRNIYNIGTEEEVSIYDLSNRIALIAGVNPIRHHGEREDSKGGTLRRCPDMTKLRALGYESCITLDDGLRETVEWYMTHSAKPADYPR
jgi:nucleoside-diphosphate-sugar epimerase